MESCTPWVMGSILHMTIYPEDMRSVDSTAEFVWFSNLFQLCKSLHETKLKILPSAYCLFFSRISVVEK